MPPNEARRHIEKLAFELGQVQRHAQEAENELAALKLVLDPKSVNWKCDGCGYEKHFTKPMLVIHAHGAKGRGSRWWIT